LFLTATILSSQRESETAGMKRALSMLKITARVKSHNQLLGSVGSVGSHNQPLGRFHKAKFDLIRVGSIQK